MRGRSTLISHIICAVIFCKNVDPSSILCDRLILIRESVVELNKNVRKDKEAKTNKIIKTENDLKENILRNENKGNLYEATAFSSSPEIPTNNEILVDNIATFLKICSNLTDKTSIRICAILKINTAIELPSNIHVNVSEGGGFDLRNNRSSLTIYGSFSAPSNQIFFGNGAVRFAQCRKSIVLLDWFGPNGDGLIDDSNIIQRAVNSANNQRLVFNPHKVYTFANVFTSLNIEIDGANCIVKPEKLAINQSGAMFTTSIDRIKAASEQDTLFSNLSNKQSLSRAKARIIEISNFQYRPNWAPFPFYYCSASNSHRDSIDVIKIHKINSKQSAAPIKIVAPEITNKNTSYIKRVEICDNNLSWNGGISGLVVDKTQPSGSKKLFLRTIDGSSFIEKVELGLFFQIAATYTPSADDSQTFRTTNAVYQVTGFAEGSTPDRGSIDVRSGAYTDQGGYLPFSDNAGTRCEILHNSWLLPIMFVRFASIYNQPSFSGHTGSSRLFRNEWNEQQNAYSTSLLVGQRFCFGPSGPTGTYVIVGINDDKSIQISPSLNRSIHSEKIYVFGKMNPAIKLNGDIKCVKISRNILVGGSHGIQISSCGGLNGNGIGKHLDEQDNILIIDDRNVIKYNWMNIETQTPISPNSSISDFLVGSKINTSQTKVRVSSFANYKVTKVDLDNDGRPEICLTSKSTKNEEVTAKNSVTLGDIFGFESIRGRYRIVNISENWEKDPSITFSRWDGKKKSDEQGGFIDENQQVSNQSQLNFRCYSKYIGSAGLLAKLVIDNNDISYNTNSDGGFLISAFARDIDIRNNKFKNSSRAAWELGSCRSLTFIKNTYHSEPFTGENPIPGTSCKVNTEGSMLGYGELFILNAGNIRIEQNAFSGISLVAEDRRTFSQLDGAIIINPSNSIIFERENFIIQNNSFPPISTSLLITGLKKRTLNGNYISQFNYNNITVRNNSFIVHPFNRRFMFADPPISKMIWSSKNIFKRQ